MFFADLVEGIKQDIKYFMMFLEPSQKGDPPQPIRIKHIWLYMSLL